MPVNVEHARKPAAEAVCEEADAVASDGPAPPNRKQLALFWKVRSSSGSLIRAHRTLCDTEAVDLTG
jgi:hypothetical protein